MVVFRGQFANWWVASPLYTTPETFQDWAWDPNVDEERRNHISQ